MQDSSRFSDRVCNPCGRKIRILPLCPECNYNDVYSTRLDKANPPWKKSKAVRVRSPIGSSPLKEVPPLMRSKKSVTFENAVNTSSALLLQESEMLSHMNVKDLPNDGVKIVFMNPSGNETVRIPRDSTKKKHW